MLTRPDTTQRSRQRSGRPRVMVQSCRCHVSVRHHTVCLSVTTLSVCPSPRCLSVPHHAVCPSFLPCVGSFFTLCSLMYSRVTSLPGERFTRRNLRRPCFGGNLSASELHHHSRDRCSRLSYHANVLSYREPREPLKYDNIGGGRYVTD